MAAPYVVAEAPPAWVAADVARPPLAESSGAAWSSWNAWRSPDKDGAMIAACYAAPVPGWVDDMRLAFSARVLSLAAASATQITGFGVEGFDHGEVLALRPAGGGETVGFMNTFLGFGGTNVHSCFVVCAGANEAPAPCNEVVVRTRLVGGDPPPQPGIALRTVTWAVHHPSTTASAFGAVTLLGAVLAVATRRKPRARG